MSILTCMSHATYFFMSPNDKPLVWLAGELRTPPLSSEARIEAGFLLRRLQQDEQLSMPHSRPMTGIGRRCHELRIVDRDSTWRVMYHVDVDAVVILEVFSKKTKATPKKVIEVCHRRLAAYREARRSSS